MQRSKFPYTARSTAKVIRHAVAIDERRGKFRQDLISETRVHQREHYTRHPQKKEAKDLNGVKRLVSEAKDISRGRRAHSHTQHHQDNGLQPPERFRNKSEVSGVRSLSPGYSTRKSVEGDVPSLASASQTSLQAIQHQLEESSDDEQEQDIQEVWFPGCHAE